MDSRQTGLHPETIRETPSTWTPFLVGKVMQEVVRQLLDAYFEPRFSNHSHGFRAGRGCHSALSEIVHTWKGGDW